VTGSPLVPDHQSKDRGPAELACRRAVRLDARYIGAQWLRGDEANETRPLSGYFVTNARIGYRREKWEVFRGGAETSLIPTGPSSDLQSEP